jgi:DNA-binding NarL/FixJ family response regulator
MRAAPDVPWVSVLALDDHAAFLGAVRAVVGATSGCEVTRRLRVIDPADVVFLLSSDDDPALQDASAACGAAVFMPKTRFGRHALASAWARLGQPTGRRRDR